MPKLSLQIVQTQIRFGAVWSEFYTVILTSIYRVGQESHIWIEMY